MGAETLGFVLGSVAAAGIGAAGASSVNSSSQSFTAGQTAEARQWQENMYHQQLGDAARLRTEQNAEYRKRLQFSAEQQKELQQYLFENYNSPAAQAIALRKAGLNPSVMLGGKSSPFGSQDLPSVGSAEPSQPALPSIPSASMVSSPSLLNPGQPIAESVNHIASSLAQLSQSKNLDASTDRVRKMLEVEYKNELERLYGQKIANSYQDFYTSFMKTNLPKKFKEEVSLLSNQAMYFHAKGEESKSQKVVNEIMEKFYQQKVDLNEPLVRESFMYCGLLLKDMEADIKLKNAQSSEAYASTRLKLQQEKTEFYNTELKTIDADISFQAKAQKLETLLATLRADAADANDKATVTEINKILDDLTLNMYKKHPDAARFDASLRRTETLIKSISPFAPKLR